MLQLRCCKVCYFGDSIQGSYIFRMGQDYLLIIRELCFVQEDNLEKVVGVYRVLNFYSLYQLIVRVLFCIFRGFEVYYNLILIDFGELIKLFMVLYIKFFQFELNFKVLFRKVFYWLFYF